MIALATFADQVTSGSARSPESRQLGGQARVRRRGRYLALPHLVNHARCNLTIVRAIAEFQRRQPVGSRDPLRRSPGRGGRLERPIISDEFLNLAETTRKNTDQDFP